VLFILFVCAVLGIVMLNNILALTIVHIRFFSAIFSLISRYQAVVEVFMILGEVFV
jgi:hypothetical protein